MKRTVNNEKTLSAREREILRYLAQGNSQKEIAEILELSQFTVDNHIRHIKEKTGLHKVTELTAAWFVKKYHLPLTDLSARLKRIIAGALLLLSLFSAVLDTGDMLRPTRARRGRKNEYELLTA